MTSFRVTCPATLSPAYDSDFLSALGSLPGHRRWRRSSVVVSGNESLRSPFRREERKKRTRDSPLPLGALSPSLVHHHLLLLLSASPSSSPPPSPLLRQTAEREAPREHRTRDWRVFSPLPPARELFTVHCLGNASRISRAEPR